MKKEGRLRRHARITRKMSGTKAKPRFVVFRSKKHIYGQLINDDERSVIFELSTRSKQFTSKKIKSSNKEGAKEVGKLFAQGAVSLGIKEACFDRGGYLYHGRVKAFADGAREGGLKF